MCFFTSITLPETNIFAPENRWLGHDCFLLCKLLLAGGFKHVLFSPRKLGKMNPFGRAYFSDGLVQPPTRSVLGRVILPTFSSLPVQGVGGGLRQCLLVQRTRWGHRFEPWVATCAFELGFQAGGGKGDGLLSLKLRAKALKIGPTCSRNREGIPIFRGVEG